MSCWKFGKKWRGRWSEKRQNECQSNREWNGEGRSGGMSTRKEYFNTQCEWDCVWHQAQETYGEHGTVTGHRGLWWIFHVRDWNLLRWCVRLCIYVYLCIYLGPFGSGCHNTPDLIATFSLMIRSLTVNKQGQPERSLQMKANHVTHLLLLGCISPTPQC